VQSLVQLADAPDKPTGYGSKPVIGETSVPGGGTFGDIICCTSGGNKTTRIASAMNTANLK
jgi:hypothetical protein